MRIFNSDPSSMTLPQWSAKMFNKWKELGKKAAALSTRHQVGAAVVNLIPEVELLIDERQWNYLQDRTGSLPFARALVHVWTTDDQRRETSLGPNNLSAVLNAHGYPFPRRLVSDLAHLHLKAFSHLSGDTFELLANGIHHGINSLAIPTNSHPTLISAITQTPHHFLNPDGPLFAAKEIVSTNIGITSWLTQRGLSGLDDTSYTQTLRHAVLLEQIKLSDPNHESSIDFLQEVTTKEVIYAPWRFGKYFGHEVLRALIERPTHRPGKWWVKAITDIAGDPRTENSQKWRQWWRGLEQPLINKTKRWLAERDLNLFLAAIENFAYETRDETQIRQFRSRHRFLVGLLEHDLIHESRLILGRSVHNALRTEIQELGINPAIYRTNTRTSIIALNCGSFQLIEGTHNFALRLFEGGPLSILTDQRTSDYTRHYFTHKLPQEHRDRNPSSREAFLRIRHQGGWQRDALNFIIGRMGIELDLEKMLDPEDYNALLRRSGAPIPGIGFGR